MTDHERLTALEARVVVLERLVELLHGGILDWAAHSGDTHGEGKMSDDHDHEFFSSCCAAQTPIMEPLICPTCKEHTSYECECGEVYKP